MKEIISIWKNQFRIQTRINRQGNRDNKKRYGDIFKIRMVEVSLMLILFLVSFLMFHYSYWALPEGGWRIPILVMSTIIINISTFGIALIGMKNHKHKHPSLLLSMLVFYAIGDVLSCFASFAGGIPYYIAQIIWCVLLFKETFIKKDQYIVFSLLCLFGILLILFCKQELLISIGIGLYILPLFAACAMSLNSPFFLLAGVFFVLSDCAALIRVSFPSIDGWWTYLIASLLYFFALLLICFSTFVTKPKESVTLSEMLRIVKTLQKYHVRFWVAGRWSANMTLGYFLQKFENTFIICDSRYLDAYKAALVELGFLTKNDPLDISQKYYCEKFGTLITATAVVTGNETRVILANQVEFQADDDFFGEKTFGRVTIPCVSLGL